MLDDVNAYIWNEKTWLPDGVHWSDFKSTVEFRRPQYTDIYYAPILAVSMLCLRYVFERYDLFHK